MKRKWPVALLTLTLALLLLPGAASGVDWKDRLEHLLAPGYRLVPGDYANGVPDTLVYNPDQTLNLLADVPPVNADGTVNAIVEIPAGTIAKWETDAETGRLFWELKNGKPRVVKYLGYPGNYGSIPGTLGGDGDPLDIICLGRMDLRGSVVPATVVGVMYMIDGGDIDDKLIAVLPGTAFDGKSLADLESMGVTTILKTWFENYKGPDQIHVLGFGDQAAALQILKDAIEQYRVAAGY